MKESNTDAWDYSPALENTDCLKIRTQYGHFIDGQFVAPAEGEFYNNTNPATGETIAQFARGTAIDIDRAVQAALKAQDGIWSKTTASERGKYLFRIARLLQERTKELIVAESLDSGKTIKDARTVDIPLACNHFFYYAGWADKLADAFPNKNIAPIGVVGQIIPWNFPLLMAAWKIAPALAAGNTVVLKPAETTPLTAMILAEILRDAQLPNGVVNIVTGFGEIGQALVEHSQVKKIAFTGSTEVGKKIMRSTATSNKKLTLELGGKSANIVFADAAIDQAVEGIIDGIFFNQGHVCCAGSRLYVEESIQLEFLEKLKWRMRQLRVGNPLDKNTDIGAIHSSEQLQKIQYYVQLAKSEGADVFMPDCPLPAQGNYCLPTIISKISQSSRVNQEELFGPVITLQSFRTVDEVLQKANNSPYGLAAGVWTEKGSKIWQMSQQLKAGVIWANTYNKFDPSSPFGGFKESGFGREGGLHGLIPYLKFNGSWND